MYDTKLRNPQTEQLVKALLLLENEEECFRFLEDLFTIREVRDLAQRREVAQMLVDKVTYAEIASRTGVSSATIGRVNRALSYGAGGYKIVLDKLAAEENHAELE